MADVGPIVPHWSDDPRFDSKEHYDAVMAGKEKLPHPNGTDRPVKSGEIDYHAAKGGYGGLWNSGI